MNTHSPRPILKRNSSSSTSSDTSCEEVFVSSGSTSSASSNSRRSVSFHNHENGTPVSQVHLTHSPCTYDRSPIKVMKNECALPERGARTFYEGVRLQAECRKYTGDDDQGRKRNRRVSTVHPDNSGRRVQGTTPLSRKELLQQEIENTSVFYGRIPVSPSKTQTHVYSLEDDEEEESHGIQPENLVAAFEDLSLTPIPSRCSTPRPSHPTATKRHLSLHPGLPPPHRRKEHARMDTFITSYANSHDSSTSGRGYFRTEFSEDMGCLGGF